MRLIIIIKKRQLGNRHTVHFTRTQDRLVKFSVFCQTNFSHLDNAIKKKRVHFGEGFIRTLAREEHVTCSHYLYYSDILLLHFHSEHLQPTHEKIKFVKECQGKCWNEDSRSEVFSSRDFSRFSKSWNFYNMLRNHL